MEESTDALIRPWLDLWHRLLGEPAIPPFESPDDMAGVLADLRRDPERLRQAFLPLPCGDEVLSRVRRCVAAESGPRGIYLQSDGSSATDDKLRGWVTAALDSGSACCEIEVPEYEIKIERRGMTAAERSAAAPLVEELGDLFINLTYRDCSPEAAAMQFLRETLYTLAASFEVQGYCLTPLCPERVRRLDPYAPQVELWLHGAHAVVRWQQGSDDWVAVYTQ